MVDIYVSQTALLAEIEAQIAEASQVALLAELGNKHSYVSQLAHVNEVDPIMVRAGQLAHINEIDPIMVRVAALCVLVELEPTPRPVGRDDELTQSVVGESVTGVTGARTGGMAASGATSSGAATGQGAEGGASASGTTGATQAANAASSGTSAQAAASSGGAAGASESAASAASAGAATSATSASVGGATATGAGSPATSAASTAGGQSGAASGGASGTETQGGTSATGAAGGQSATAASSASGQGGTAASGATGASAQSAAPPSATGATGGTAASAAGGGSTSGATPASGASGGQPGQPGAGSAGGVAAGVAAAIAAAGAQAATVSQAAVNAQNALFATLAASRGAVAQGTNLGIVSGGTGGSVSEVRSIVAAAYVDWDRNGIYTNESAYLISARGNSSLTAPEQMLTGGRGQVASCQIVLDNKTRRFSPANSSGALYSYIAGGAAYMLPVLVDVTIDGNTKTLFTGYIRELSESAPTPTQTGRVTLECRAKDEKLLQDKLSTPLADFLADSAAAHTEDFHIINLLEAAGMVDGTDFVSPAYALANSVLPTIDGGIFPIRYVWLDDESVLDEIWQLTAACCGWFYCDHLGKFHYHNLTAVLPDALERQYGSLTTLALDEEQVVGLQLKWPTAELYNEMSVEVSPRAPGEAGEIWTPDDPIVVQPDQTKVVWCRLDASQTIAPTLTFQGYTAGGIPLNTNIVVERTNYAQRVRLSIWNNNTQAAYLNTLRLDGQTLTGGRTLEAEKVSAESFWTNRPTRRRSIRNNIYIQSEAQAETIAAYALKRQELPVLMATIPGVDNPDLRLAYPVSIEYSNVVPTADKITGIVSGLSWRLDNTGFRQDVTVLETASLFADYDPIFVLGTNKLGAAGADTAYLFY